MRGGKFLSVNNFSAQEHALSINPLTPGTFGKKFVFWTLVIFRLDLGQITSNPVENAFATQQLAFLATSIAF